MRPGRVTGKVTPVTGGFAADSPLCCMRPRALLAAFLAALPLSGLSAQTINVVASRGLRPTAVLLPHTRWIVAADSAEDGVAVISELSVPPVTFTGTVRVEGVRPGTRAPSGHAFADTVRFEPDGRVRLLVADQAGRAPMSVEVTGSRAAAAGRINVTAPGMPLGRVLLVTIMPADIYETGFRSAGYGVRDRIRVDDRLGFAFLSDSSTGPTTVAIGFGRGTGGRIQSDVASVVLERDFGGQTGRERRAVGALTMIVDPSREDEATARAEIVFGVGNTEAEAMGAARAASDEPPSVPRTAALRVRTPSPEVAMLVTHLLGTAGWMLDWDVPGGERAIPVSALRPVVRAEDAWAAAPLALQRGDTAAVCGSSRLLRGGTSARARVQVAPRLGSRGRYLAAIDSASAVADAAILNLAYACYAATRDSAFFRTEFAALEDARRARRASMPATTALWRSVQLEAQRGIQQDYGRLSAAGGPAGTSLAAGGAFLSLLVGDVFGVTPYLDRLEIAPQVEGIADDFTWQLDGWQLGGGDALGITYRPSSRSAVIRLSSGQRHRVVLRFPWLAAASCVIARRGPDRERLALVTQSDGSFYVDVRSFFDPPELTVSAGACAGGP